MVAFGPLTLENNTQAMGGFVMQTADCVSWTLVPRRKLLLTTLFLLAVCLSLQSNRGLCGPQRWWAALHRLSGCPDGVLFSSFFNSWTKLVLRCFSFCVDCARLCRGCCVLLLLSDELQPSALLLTNPVCTEVPTLVLWRDVQASPFFFHCKKQFSIYSC